MAEPNKGEMGVEKKNDEQTPSTVVPAANRIPENQVTNDGMLNAACAVPGPNNSVDARNNSGNMIQQNALLREERENPISAEDGVEVTHMIQSNNGDISFTFSATSMRTRRARPARGSITSRATPTTAIIPLGDITNRRILTRRFLTSSRATATTTASSYSSNTEDEGTGREDIGRLDTGRPNTGRPDIGRPNTGRPDIGRPNTGRPDTGRPNTGRPDIGRPNTGRPDTGRPDTGRPNTDRPNTDRPNTDRPDTGRPDTGRQEENVESEVEISTTTRRSTTDRIERKITQTETPTTTSTSIQTRRCKRRSFEEIRTLTRRTRDSSRDPDLNTNHSSHADDVILPSVNRDRVRRRLDSNPESEERRSVSFSFTMGNEQNTNHNADEWKNYKI